MGDTGDLYNAMREARKERHAKWHEENMKIMNESGIQFEAKNYGESLVTPLKAVFHPSTGRWVYKNRSHRGGAKAFVAWYRELEKEVKQDDN